MIGDLRIEFQQVPGARAISALPPVCGVSPEPFPCNVFIVSAQEGESMHQRSLALPTSTGSSISEKLTHPAPACRSDRRGSAH